MTAVSTRPRPGGYASGSSSPSVGARLRRVLTYRRTLRLLVARDLKIRYAGSALGYVWTVLDPLLMSLVYWFVFTKIFHRSAGADFTPFMMYLVTGQLAWSWFAGGVTGVTKALRSEAQMVRSTNVPRELWVLRAVLSRGLEYLFGLPVIAIFAIAYATAPTKYLVLLPIGWLLEAVLILGIGLILAPATVLVNDLERIVPIVMRVLFYASPVLYSVSNVPRSLQTAFSINPTVGFLTVAHAEFFTAAIHEKHVVHIGAHPALAPDAHAVVVAGKLAVRPKPFYAGGRTVTEHISHWDWIWHSAITSLVILAIGVVVFARLERPVLKEI